MSHLINYKIMLYLFYVCNDKFNVSRHVGISRLQRSQVDCEDCLPKQNINIQQYIPSLQSTWNVVSARKSRWKKRLQIKNRGSLSISSMWRNKTRYWVRLSEKAFLASMYVNQYLEKFFTNLRLHKFKDRSQL